MPFDHSSTSLADVITELEALPTLSTTRRRDLISAITRTATFLNRAPTDLPTDAPTLRTVLATIHPAQAGISAKSLANIKANLAAALRITRFAPRNLPKVEHTATWTAFLQHASGDHQIHALSRFVGYCCRKGIDPDGVTDVVMAGFRSYLDTRLLAKDPSKLCKEMVWTWNGIVKREALPLTTLTTTVNPRYRCRPLKDYPAAVQAEIADYLEGRAEVGLFDPDGPDQALRPTSLRNTKAHLTQFFDALVNAGTDPAQITGLADVVSAAHMRVAFKAHIDRTGVPLKSGTLQNIAATLVVIARVHLKVQPKELDAMLGVKKRVSTNPKSITAKNSQRLMQFNNWENVVRLAALPEVLMDRAKSGATNRTTALSAMHAVALSILLSCPMRMANLASLDLDRHLTSYRTGSHTMYSIRIEGADVKNHEPIEIQLSGANSAILHRYITKFRNVVTEAQSTALFPTKGDGLPRAPGNLSGELTALVYRETGLVINPHLFRHFAAKIYLDANPGHYETVRQLLRHKNVQTTINFYSELTCQHAHDSYSAVLNKFGGRRD